MRIILLVCAFIAPFYAFTQSKVYRVTFQNDIPHAAAGISTFIAANKLSKDRVAISIENVPVLNRSDVWRFDRSATRRQSYRSADVSDVFLFSSFGAPALLLINKNVRREAPAVGLIYAETMMLSIGVNSLVKELSSRFRPYMYNENVPNSSKTGKDCQRSFFSGHVSVTATSFFFMAKVYSDLNPESRLKPLVWTAAAMVPAAVGGLRYAAGKHYPTDILVGYITGAAIGYLVPHMHKKRNKEDKSDYLQPL